MGRLRTAHGLAAGAAVVVGLLLLPGAGEAKFPMGDEGSEALPGVTITGIGLARAEDDAVSRAVRDARRRAASIAGVLGIQLGDVEQVELQQISQFGEPRPCRREPGGSPRCRLPDLEAAAATVTFAIFGGSDGAASERRVVVPGAASAAVRPASPLRNQPIKRALLAARRTATPAAAAVTRRNARIAARSAGLRLGPIVSIAEAPPLYYGSVFYDAALGSFGPGRFCGFVRRPIVRRDPETGVPRVVRRVRQRRCVIPRPYTLRLEARYEAR
ncbi:MAG TPA: SIMPL domain-containing protein [Solirubrobacterales bacterium]|nr:SIMPL domain-containing protein [Solirubrobacterales bacterium]